MKNLLEGAVLTIYEELVAKTPGACSCESCREDALAYVLNKTRPRYSGGTDTGWRSSRSTCRRIRRARNSR